MDFPSQSLYLTLGLCPKKKKKARGSHQENPYFCFTDSAKAFGCADHNELWKMLTEMGTPDRLTCLLRTYMQVRKQQLELDMEEQTGSK